MLTRQASRLTDETGRSGAVTQVSVTFSMVLPFTGPNDRDGTTTARCLTPGRRACARESNVWILPHEWTLCQKQKKMKSAAVKSVLASTMANCGRGNDPVLRRAPHARRRTGF